jgi:hypothetical protein
MAGTKRRTIGNVLTQQQCNYLLTGRYFLARPFRSATDAKAAWSRHRAHLISFWISDPDAWHQTNIEARDNPAPAGPGHRPFAWWRFEHPDLFRKHLGGTGVPCNELEDAPPWTLQNHFGTPRGTWSETAEEIPEPVFEPEAACLKRAGLLSPEEARRLKPRDYEPEPLSPETEEEGTEDNTLPDDDTGIIQ